MKSISSRKDLIKAIRTQNDHFNNVMCECLSCSRVSSMKFVYLKNIHKYIQLNNWDMMVMFKIQSAVLVLTYHCSSVGSDDLPVSIQLIFIVS